MAKTLADTARHGLARSIPVLHPQAVWIECMPAVWPGYGEGAILYDKKELLMTCVIDRLRA